MPIKRKYKLIIFLCSLAFLFSRNSFSQSLPSEAPSSSTQEAETFKDQKSQEGYIVNLKDLINRSKKKIEEVNVKLEEQARRSRNQQREEKAREYYEQAMRLFKEGKLEQAQELWQKAIKITEHPEMKGYLSESAAKTKKQQDALRSEESRRMKRLEIERGYSAEEVEKAYDEAVKLYKQKKYVEAKDGFERVEDMFPDHKATRSYLMVIEQEIQKEQQQLIDNKLKEEETSRQKAKEAWRKELEQRENERKDFLDKQAQTIYEDAVKLYRAREFEKAKERFKEVEWVYPNYKSTAYFLSGIDNDIKEEDKRREVEHRQTLKNQLEEDRNAKKKEEARQLKLREAKELESVKSLKDQAEFVYKTGITLFKKGQYEDAKAKFLEANQLSPNYKETNSYIAQIDESLAKEKSDKIERARQEFELQVKQDRLNKSLIEEEQRKKFEQEEKDQIEKTKSEAELVYKTAVALYDNALYVQAQEKFLQLEQFYPNYKSTKDYLKKITARVPSSNEPESQIKSVQKASQKEPNRKKRQIEEQQFSENQESVKQQAEVLYKSALSCYENKLYLQSKEKFNELEAVSPNYRSTRKYLELLKKKIVDSEPEEIAKSSMRGASGAFNEEEVVVKKAVEARQQQMSQEAEQKYQEAVTFYKERKIIEAQRKFIQVEALYPDYKETAKYLSRIDDEITGSEKIGTSLKAKKASLSQESSAAESSQKAQRLPACTSCSSGESTASIEGLYQSAIKLFNSKDYESAQAQFEEVNLRKSGYKSTKRYLDQTKKKLDALETEQKRNQNQAVLDEHLQKKNIKSGILESKAQALYKEAVKLYQTKLFVQAQEKFLAIEDLTPEYKDTDKYLKLIAEKIKKQQDQESALNEKIEAARKEALMVDEPKEQEQKDRQEFRRRLERKYQEAVKFYKKNRFEEAKKDFLEVQASQPNYQETADYLARIDGDIQSQQQQNISIKSRNVQVSAKELYQTALAYYNKKEYQKAQDKFKELNELIFDYKSTNEYLDQLEKKLLEVNLQKNQCLDECLNDCMERCMGVREEAAGPKKARSKNQVCVTGKPCYDLSEETDEIYRNAVAMYKAGSFQQAKAKFNEVSLLLPGYKNTESYLIVIERKLAQEQKKRERESQIIVSDKQKESLEDQARIRRDINAKKTSWEIGVEERVAMLKAKERELDYLKGARKAEYEREIREERTALAQLREKWAQQEHKRKREFRVRFNEEEKRNRLVLEEARRLKVKKQKDLEKKLKAEKWEKERQKAEQEKQRKIEAEKKHQEELLKKKAELDRMDEETRKKKEEEQKRLEGLNKEKEVEKVKLQEAAEQKQKEQESKEAAEKKQAEAPVVKAEEHPIEQAMVSPEATPLSAPVAENQVKPKSAASEYEYKEYKEELEKERIKNEYEKYRKEQITLEKKQQAEFDRQRKQRSKESGNRKEELRKELLKEAGVLYQEGLSLYQQKFYKDAKAKFMAAEGLYPGYKSAGEYIARCEDKMIYGMAGASKERKVEPKSTKLNDAEAIYKEAVQAYQYEDYPAAKDKFTAVLKLNPDNRSAQNYLKKTERKLAEEEKNKQDQERRRKDYEAKKEKERQQKELDEKKRKEKEDARRKDKEEKERLKQEKKLKREQEAKEKLEHSAKQKSEPEAKQKASSQVESPAVETKQEVKSETKPEAELETKPEAEQPSKPEVKQEVKQEVKLEIPKQDQNLNKKEKKEEQKKLQAGYEKIYRDAIALYKTKDFEKAKVAFEALENTAPGYKSARDYIIKCQDSILKQKQKEEKENADRERLRKEENLKKAKENLEQNYRDAVNAYQAKDMATGDEKFAQLSDMLAKGDFPSEYVQSMTKKMDQKKSEIQKTLANEEQKRKVAESAKAELETRAKKIEDEKRHQELEKLEKEIRLEEERLKQQKQLEEQRMEKEQQKQTSSAAPEAKKAPETRKSVRQEHIAQKYAEALREQKRLSQERAAQEKREREDDLERRRIQEKERRAQLEQMVKDRQQQLLKEREQVRESFLVHIEALYQTAVKLYQKKSYAYAGHIFQEIDSMVPHYKKTAEYLKDILRKISYQTEPVPSSFSENIPSVDSDDAAIKLPR
ncbi:MAG: hypothetical protein HQL24_06040 [Candidatus Omnitrophica bacterium]|nr:hypothetical protein [Candidatus Omnitrophota bacterium]